MSELVGHILKKLYLQAPEQVLEDPLKLQGLLNETCPDEAKAIRMVVVGLVREVPQTLLDTPEPMLPRVMSNLAEQLSQEHAMHLRFGEWLVGTWAKALGFLPLHLNPINIFAEAEHEYCKAVKAVLNMTAESGDSGEPSEHLLQELEKMQHLLLITNEQSQRLFADVKQTLNTKKTTVAEVDSSVEDAVVNRLGMGFLKVKAGSFLMGSPEREYLRERDETQHKVTLSKDYYLQTHLVTQAQWQKVMGNNPSDFKGPNLPVDNVSWSEIVTQFLPRLNAREEGVSYRLPTEAEWEYAARAGGEQAYGYFDDMLTLGDYAWFNSNSAFKTHPVGTKKANPWGFFDMQGNVWEWCHDWYAPYQPIEQIDPSGSERSSGRTMRGGSWFGGGESCRCAARGYMAPVTRIRLIGFRLVKEEA